MENKRAIKMTPAICYEVDETALKIGYTTLALAQYRWLRKPEYFDHVALKLLHRDLKRYYSEIQSQCESAPNNLLLSHMRRFFDIHYRAVDQIIEKIGD